MNINDLEQMTVGDYHALTGKLASRGMQLKAERGIYPSAAPLGYKNVHRHGESRLEVDPEVAPLIQLAFAHHQQGLSIRKSLRILTEAGLRSRRGNVLTASALLRLLRNPIYRGLVRWKGKEIVGHHESLM